MIYQIPYIFHIYEGSKKHPNSKWVRNLFNFHYGQYNTLISRKINVKQSPNILALKYTYLILKIFFKRKLHLKQLAYKLVDDLCGMGDIHIIDVEKYLKGITLTQGNYTKTFDQMLGVPIVENFTEVEREQVELLIAVHESKYYETLIKFINRKFKTLGKTPVLRGRR